jgi:hypothetical protein
VTDDRTRLIHLAGYASITAVLATADWAGLSAPLLALPIVLGALYAAGDRLIRRLTARARRDMETHVPAKSATTDGGRLRDPDGTDPIEDRQTTTAGDRHPPHDS